MFGTITLPERLFCFKNMANAAAGRREEFREIYDWVDKVKVKQNPIAIQLTVTLIGQVPFTRVQKSFARDFSDACLVAEVCCL